MGKIKIALSMFMLGQVFKFFIVDRPRANSKSYTKLCYLQNKV